MIHENALEPGILKTFRLFIGIRLALVLNSLFYLAIFSHWEFPYHIQMLVVMVVLDASLLLAYLSLPWPISLLKQKYLPIAILWATLGPMVQMYIGFLLTKSDTMQLSTYFMTPLPFLMMFIPLVIVAWQYSQRYVFLYCGSTFLVDMFFAFQTLFVSRQSFIAFISIALIRTLVFLLVGNMITNLMKVQREQRQRLIEANSRLAHYAVTMEQLTISRERNRMARELHDVMAHTLSGVAVELEGVRSMLKVSPERAEELLVHSLHAVRGGLTETRRALRALRSSPLEDLGLGAAIRNLVETIPGNAGLAIDVNTGDINGEGIPIDVQQCFYRVAQETLSNIVDHARASKVSVRLQRRGATLTLFIEDDGIGFTEDPAEMEGKYGLMGMRERAEMIKGQLTITSRPGVGTQVRLSYGGQNGAG